MPQYALVQVTAKDLADITQFDKDADRLVERLAMTRGYQLFGVLWNAGIVKSPGLFFCPIRNDDSNAYNTGLNPWPPGQPAPADAATRTG